MHILVFALLYSFAFADNDSFITDIEYGSFLYNHTKRISCQKCHGTKGDKKVLFKYTDKGKKVIITAPNINNMNYNQFSKSLDRQNYKVMPSYDFLESEKKALYKYIQSLNKK